MRLIAAGPSCKIECLLRRPPAVQQRRCTAKSLRSNGCTHGFSEDCAANGKAATKAPREMKLTSKLGLRDEDTAKREQS